MSKVPVGWKEVKLEKICNVSSGATPETSKSDYWDGNIVWVTPNDLNKLKGSEIYTSERKISDEGLKSCSTQLVDKNSIIMSSRAPIGYLAINKVEAATNQGCKSFVDLKVDYKYFYYSLSCFMGKIKQRGEGTTFDEISKTQLEKIKIILPKSVDEQLEVAKILNNIDNNIEKTQELIKKYEMIKQGLTHDLFTKGLNQDGKPYNLFKDSKLGRIPINWDLKCLEKLIDIKHGYAFKGEYFTDIPTDYVLLTPGNFHVKGGLYFNRENTKYYSGSIPRNFILKNGDLLIVMTDLTKEMAILGSTVILETRFNVLHNQRIGKISIKDPDKVLDNYVLFLMNTHYCKDEVKRTATGTTVRHTAPDRIVKALVPLPSYDEQKRISDILITMEKKILAERQYYNKLKKIKAGLMQDLLTGKVRAR